MNSQQEALIHSLRDRSARDSFSESLIAERLPMKIRALRMDRKLTQAEMATRMDRTQAWVAKLEDPAYAKFSLATLLKVARALDVGLSVDFVPFSRLAREVVAFSERDLQVRSFDEEIVSEQKMLAFGQMQASAVGSSAAEMAGFSVYQGGASWSDAAPERRAANA